MSTQSAYKPNFWKDYQNFFTGGGEHTFAPGKQYDWAGGQISLDPSKKFGTYTGPQGGQVKLTPDNPWQAAQKNSNILNQWNTQYGNDWYTPPATEKAPNIYSDWESFFGNDYQPGQTMNWAGGALQTLPGGTVQYTGPGVSDPYKFNQSTPLYDIWENVPGAKTQWQSQYGPGIGQNILAAKPAPTPPPKIVREYQDWFSTTPLGTEIDWAGGKLRRRQDGALYTAPDGRQVILSPDADMDQLAELAQRFPSIKSHWDETYSGWYDPYEPKEGIEIPDPSEMEGPTSWAGIDPAFQENLTSWMNNLTNILNPQSYQGYMNSAFNPAIGQAEGHWDQASQGLGQLYQGILRPLLQQEMNSLAGRNMVDSTVASEGLAGAANKADTAILDRAQQINTAKAGALSNILSQRAAASAAYPDALGNLAQLTRASGSTNDAYSYAVFGDILAALLPFLQPGGGGLTSNEIGQGGA